MKKSSEAAVAADPVSAALLVRDKAAELVSEREVGHADAMKLEQAAAAKLQTLEDAQAAARNAYGDAVNKAARDGSSAARQAMRDASDEMALAEARTMQARKELADARGETATAAAAVEDAQRTHRVADLHYARMVRLNGPYLESLTESLVAHIVSARETLKQIREEVVVRQQLVAELQQLGAGEGLAAVDFSAPAGLVARALVARGASLPPSFHDSLLRHMLEPRLLHRTRDREGTEGVQKTIEVVLSILDAPEYPAGRKRLETIAQVWPHAAERHGATAAVDAIGQLEVATEIEESAAYLAAARKRMALPGTKWAGFPLREDENGREVPVGNCRVCEKPCDSTCVIDVVGQRRVLRHASCAVPVEMPVVDRQPSPPGTWKDGEYTVEAFVRDPTVG